MAKASATPVTEFAWGIAQLERYTKDEIVLVVHYTVDANDGTFSSSTYGSVGLEQPDEDKVIPFADLTKELVVSWVQEKLGGDEKVEEIEKQLQKQLDEQRSPTITQGVPWS